jgi:hypothetical protein
VSERNQGCESAVVIIKENSVKRFNPTLTLAASAIVLIGLVSNATWADNPDNTDKSSSERALKQVTNDIKYLSSDEMGGRQPGTPGIDMALKFIVEEYEKINLEKPCDGTYLQDMEVGNEFVVNEDEAELALIGPQDKEIKLKLGEEFRQLVAADAYDLLGNLVFVGYGIKAEDQNYDEISPVDLEGKVVIVLRREPQQNDENSVFDGKEASSHSYIRTKVRKLRAAKAAAILFVNDASEEAQGDPLVESSEFGTTTNRIPCAQIKRKAIDQILAEAPLVTGAGVKLSTLAQAEKAIDEKLEPLSQTLEGWSARMKGSFTKKGVKTSNIVGVIEGEGPHADETIIIGGHYDHLGLGAYGSRAPGRKEIHNGADDNATGTAAVMELARRFAQRDKKPARRLVFICFSAEEMGLLGAQYYVEHPVFPLEKTVAMVNFDMIGWYRESGDGLTVFNWNSCPDFGPILDKANEGLNVKLNKPGRGFAGSDHLPFFQKQIPVMFMHTGLTDTYHTPEDDFETIDCAGALKVIDYTEHVIDGIANLDKTPVFGSPEPMQLGVVLSDDEDVVKIESVADGSIAQRSGLQAGDIIVAMDDEALTSRRQVTRNIRRDEGKTVKFKIKRDDAEIVLNVTLKKEIVQ